MLPPPRGACPQRVGPSGAGRPRTAFVRGVLAKGDAGLAKILTAE